VRIAYFDCIAGITGDTALGALIDAGADVDRILEALGTLPLEPFDLEIDRVEEQQIAATRVSIRTQTTGVIRTYSSVRSLLDAAELPAEARRLSHRMFRLYAEAEARVSRRDPDQVRFHDTSGLDTILDLVGVATALTLLGVERVFSSAVPTGLGMTKSEHGAMPIPTPTVLELLRGAPLFSRGVAAELTNAGGAAILAATVEGYGDLPATRISSVGYGAGSQRLDIPNVLRVVLGEEEPASSLPSPSGTPDLYLVTDEVVEEDAPAPEPS
jgi:pyridinium-3,5-bisthiocarboxylic acid mononucleotide nickel chelatase